MHLQQLPLLWVHVLRFTRRDAEEGGAEMIEVRNERAPAGICRRLQSSAPVLAIKGRFLLTIGDPKQSVILTLCDPVLAITR